MPKQLNLYEKLSPRLTSSPVIEKYKNDFTRKRKLPFHVLIVFLINLVKGSYQDELDKFFKTILRFDVAKRVLSKAALAKARMKLKFEAFVELNLQLITYFEKHFRPKLWFGLRLLAIDGSTTKLPMTDDVVRHFGVWNVRQGAPSPMARVSQLFDVLNKITVDALIKPKRIGERDLAAQHLLNVMPNDLILLDRGYPAWWLFNLILSMQANFCARVSCTKWKIVRKFFRSGLSEKVVTVPVHSTSIAQCRQMGLDTTPLKLRLIRIENDGKVAVLITSLVDTEKYPIELFGDLYHKRWPVEEDYKIIKCRIELDNFSGQSALSVYQDFHAKVFAKNLVWMMAFHVQDRIDDEIVHTKHRYQINFTQALSKSKGVIALLFLDANRLIKRLIVDLQYIFQRTVEPIRPGRKYPRNHKAKPRRYFPQYKPIG
ncbi:IS4 family transposase [uncultured Desulfosarcina sp.]|uniref:IS4 family transposase n=1 Tax=uncultured Desulfosarcina sp. TaxID=218289 RepID=UPI0029C75441|nr:IS4 family transposase [uncultured Desulfosarcina sp.]